VGERQRETLVFGRGLDRYSPTMVAEPASFYDLMNVHVQGGRIESRYGNVSRHTIASTDAILQIQPVRAQAVTAIVVLDGSDVKLFYSDAGMNSAPVLVGTIWAGISTVAGFPRIICMDSYDKLVICHDEPTFALRQKTKYWNVTANTINDLDADLYQATAPETLVDTFFRGVTRHLAYLFYWGYGSENAGDGDRGEIVRHSTPADPLVLKEQHYFVAGQRGEPVITCVPAGNILLVLKEYESHRIIGSDRPTFGILPYEDRNGCIGSRLATTVGDIAYFWSHLGPRLSDGDGPSVDLALPLDIPGPTPSELATEITGASGFVAHYPARREIAFFFDEFAYVLSIADPRRPEWSFRRLGFVPYCANVLYQSTAGVGTTLGPDFHCEFSADALTGGMADDRSMLLDWNNVLDAGGAAAPTAADKAEIWARETNSKPWSKVLDNIALAGATDQATVVLPFYATVHEVAIRVARNGVYNAAYQSSNPKDWPAVSRRITTVTEMTVAPTITVNRWERTSAVAEQIVFNVAGLVSQLNVDVYLQKDVGAGFVDCAGPIQSNIAAVTGITYVLGGAEGETTIDFKARYQNAAQTGPHGASIQVYAGPQNAPSGMGIVPDFPGSGAYNTSWTNGAGAAAAGYFTEVHADKDGGGFNLAATASPSETQAIIALSCPTVTATAKARHKAVTFGVSDYSEFSGTDNTAGNC
jgi:hypothetical protein